MGYCPRLPAYSKAVLPALALMLAPLPPIDPAALRATIERLSSWHTRHISSTTFDEAVDWIAGEYRKIPGAKVELFEYPVVKGPRVAADRNVRMVLCRLEPNQPDPQPGLVMMGGHLDTINMTGPADTTLRSPGANDDASGSAATLECARAMAARPRRHPMIFIGFTGEEQNLLSSRALAARAKTEGWTIDALLNNDIVGNSSDLLGERDPREVRVFSELSPDHQARELARFMEWLQRTQGAKGFGVKLVFRNDRFGRGGDHTPFNQAGFTAVRLTETFEEYTRQHTDQDLPQYVDYGYLSRVAGLNLLALDRLANAGPPPTRVRIGRAQGHDTVLTWTATPGVDYTVYWRDTAHGAWEQAQRVGAAATTTLKKVSHDEHEFAVGADGGIPVPAT